MYGADIAGDTMLDIHFYRCSDPNRYGLQRDVCSDSRYSEFRLLNGISELL